MLPQCSLVLRQVRRLRRCEESDGNPLHGAWCTVGVDFCAPLVRPGQPCLKGGFLLKASRRVGRCEIRTCSFSMNHFVQVLRLGREGFFSFLLDQWHIPNGTQPSVPSLRENTTKVHSCAPLFYTQLACAHGHACAARCLHCRVRPKHQVRLTNTTTHGALRAAARTQRCRTQGMYEHTQATHVKLADSRDILKVFVQTMHFHTVGVPAPLPLSCCCL